jgi:Zn-dependent oligopeptidase
LSPEKQATLKSIDTRHRLIEQTFVQNIIDDKAGFSLHLQTEDSILTMPPTDKERAQKAAKKQ